MPELSDIYLYIFSMVIHDCSLEYTKSVVHEQFVGEEAVSDEQIEKLYDEATKQHEFFKKINKESK